MLPNFLIIGAARSGTTSLSSYLGVHPEVFMCQLKEPHFFAFENSDQQFKGPYDDVQNKHIIRDISAYKGLFSNYNGEKAIGETSPGYLFLPQSAENIKSKIPDAKIIMILRDPVKRCFSHYNQHIMMGQEDLDFEEALKEEKNRKDFNWRWFYQYRGQSLYYNQVKIYKDIFKEEQLKIILFEDMVYKPVPVLQEISEFLKIDTEFYTNFQFKIKYQSGTPKSKVVDSVMRSKGFIKKAAQFVLTRKMRNYIYKFLKRKNYDYSKKEIPEGMSSSLKEYFREDVLKLQKIVDKDLSRWSPIENPN